MEVVEKSIPFPVASTPTEIKENQTKCQKCGFKAMNSNLIALQFHCFSKHLSCVECKLDFESKEETVDHMVSVHSIKVQCHLCSYSCLDPNWLDYHIAKKHAQTANDLCSTADVNPDQTVQDCDRDEIGKGSKSDLGKF